MNQPTDRLRREYTSALQAYLATGGERELSHAYELGRHAMIEGLGVLDVAVLHQAAIKSLGFSSPPDGKPAAIDAAATFFQELLSPFEMSFRGYRSANEELQRLNQTLRQQTEALQNLNRELESFSYSVSHDLRAPLRAIDGFSQILLEDYAAALDEEGKKYIGFMHEAAQHMAQLIDDLLKLARVTRSEIHVEDVDLSAIVHRIADRLLAAAPERRVDFSIEDGVRGKADARLVEVLLENLLGNAWKFTSKRERATIAFGHEAREGVTAYYVRDNGAGFDMTYADKLFRAFQRLHSTGEFEGTGIGLATVQRVVHRHEGRVWARGVVDGGATFTFTLGPSA